MNGQDSSDHSKKPNWRFRQACDVVRSGAHLPVDGTDAVVLGLRRILAAQERAREQGVTSPRMEGCDEDLAVALSAYHDSTTSLMRWKLESYLITNLEFAEIASRTGVSARTVQLFRLAFFDIDRADPAYTVNELLNAVTDAPPDQLIPDRGWKRAALLSVESLEQLMNHQSESVLGEIVSACVAEVRFEAVEKARLAVRNLEPDAPNAIHKLGKIVENTQEVTASDQPSQMANHVKAMLENLPLARGEVAPENSHPGLAKYDGSSVELSYDGTMRVAAGERLPDEECLIDLRLSTNARKRFDDRGRTKCDGHKGRAARSEAQPSAQRRHERRCRQIAAREARQKELQEEAAAKESSTSSEEDQPAGSKESGELNQERAGQEAADKGPAKNRTRLLTRGELYRLDLKRLRLRARSTEAALRIPRDNGARVGCS